MADLVSIRIETDNAAFLPHPEDESARLIRRVANMIEQSEYSGTLHDYNGNLVGEWSVHSDNETPGYGRPVTQTWDSPTDSDGRERDCFDN